MASQRVLLSGDYWHADFKDLIARISIPVTLMPLTKAATADTSRFSLIVVAQARPGQFDQDSLNEIVASNPHTPTVLLLGTWCEGERRSGQPVSGVNRVYWHQWKGRFDDFRQQMAERGISPWHAPLTQTDADRVMEAESTTSNNRQTISDGAVVAVSAFKKATYESLSEAIESMDGKPKWVERSTWINLAASVSVMLIDADSMDQMMERRIEWLKKQVRNVPMIAVMNFPRQEEVKMLEQLGVTAVVSKPFEINDLRSALNLAINKGYTPVEPIRGPSFSRSRKSGSVSKTAE